MNKATKEAVDTTRNFLEDFKEATPKIFIEYERSGGRRNEVNFTKILGEFYEYTMDSYIFGDCQLHGNCQESWDKWKKSSKLSSSEAVRVFLAVDYVNSYT